MSSVPEVHSAHRWPFPGRWFGGVCLTLSPLVVLTGALLRIQFHFFAPEQLKAYEAHPVLLTAAYSMYSMGWVFLTFGILLLVHRIDEWNRTWAFWGGALALLGMLNRAFNAGADYMAFQMVKVLGADQAFGVVSDTYTAFHVFRYLNASTMLGWPLLAIGAYRAGVLGGVRSSALALMFMLPFGTLKGTELRSIALLGLCVALVPLGVRTLREGPPLTRRAKAWVIGLALFNVLCIVLTAVFPETMRH